jgi:hypothetical protein
MFGRNQQPELTQRHLDACARDCRTRELADDPSDIPGMTQRELNDVINTGSIPTRLLNEIL